MMRAYCEPVVVLTWQQEDVVKELRSKGYEVHIIAPPVLSDAYLNIRRKIDIWFDHYRLKSPSKSIQENYLGRFFSARKKFVKHTSVLYNVIKHRIPGYSDALFRKEEDMLKSETGYAQMLDKVSSLNIDAVFTVTPFHQQEDCLLRACAQQNKKMITSILSFDNITKRGWIPVHYDAYMVWNQYNKDQLLRIYPGINIDKIFITGAPQFDFYFRENWLMDKMAWLKQFGLEHFSGKIILYAGGPASLFPDEPSYLVDIAKSVQAGMIHPDTIILFRCHPMDNVVRWKSALSGFSNIIFESSWSGLDIAGNANITEDDIIRLCSTLAYSDVHINVCSTMTVDGCAFDKPQIAPWYDNVDPEYQEKFRMMYRQEHYLPILKTKGLFLAESASHMVSLINAALDTPDQFKGGCAEILRKIVTYTDGKSSERVAGVIRSLL